MQVTSGRYNPAGVAYRSEYFLMDLILRLWHTGEKSLHYFGRMISILQFKHLIHSFV